jgi:hypothetical protein
VVRVDVVGVGVGVDEEADRLVRDPPDLRQEAPGHRGAGQAVDHDHVAVADDYPGRAVPDEGGCRNA